MSHVRPLEASDIDDIADLYISTFINARIRSPQALRTYMREFYLDGPFRDVEIPSLVHVDSGGNITGFIGVHSVPYIITDLGYGGASKKVRAAICGALMVKDRDRNPLPGARLLKAFLGGHQDISLSETASPVAQAMWTHLRGQVLYEQSLDWFRILRPASFALSTASRRLPILKLLGTATRFIDDQLGRGLKVSSATHFIPERRAAKLMTVAGDLSSFEKLVRRLTEEYSARPDWSGGYLEHVLGTAFDKPEFGQPFVGLVQRKDGELLGGFLLHMRPGGIARVLQIVSSPGHFGVVIDCLCDEAYRQGASGIRGRSNPFVFKELVKRSMCFAAFSASVIHCNDPNLALPFMDGNCFLNGLAGETWSRFFGGGLV
jgi:hypothetical protein